MDNEKKEFFSNFSKKIGNDIRKFAKETALAHSRYIFIYNKSSKKRRKDSCGEIVGYCTHCEKQVRGVYGEEYHHNEVRRCPNCDKVVKVKLERYGRKYLFDEGYFIYFEKSLVDPDVIVARSFYCSRYYKGDYESVETKFRTVNYFVFKLGNPQAYTRRLYYNQLDEIGDIDDYYKVGTISSICGHNFLLNKMVKKSLNTYQLEVLVSKSELKYSSSYTTESQEETIKYLELYCKRPNIELLSKVGLNKLITGKIFSFRTYNSIKWSGKTIFEMLKIDRNDWKVLSEISSIIDFELLNFYHLTKNYEKYKNGVQVENIYRAIYTGSMITVMKYIDIVKPSKIIKYRKKQGDQLGFINNYYDYLEMSKKLGYNLNNKSVLFPKDFKKAHKKAIDLIIISKNKLKDKEMKKRYPILKKYLFKHNGLEIVIPNDTKDFIHEGNVLEHCIANYIDRHIKGSTNILFIRKSNDIKTPYFTMEIRNNRIIQARGFDDIYYTTNAYVKEFVEQFEAEVLNKKKNKKRKIA